MQLSFILKDEHVNGVLLQPWIKLYLSPNLPLYHVSKFFIIIIILHKSLLTISTFISLSFTLLGLFTYIIHIICHLFIIITVYSRRSQFPTTKWRAAYKITIMQWIPICRMNYFRFSEPTWFRLSSGGKQIKCNQQASSIVLLFSLFLIPELHTFSNTFCGATSGNWIFISWPCNLSFTRVMDPPRTLVIGMLTRSLSNNKKTTQLAVFFHNSRLSFCSIFTSVWVTRVRSYLQLREGRFGQGRGPIKWRGKSCGGKINVCHVCTYKFGKWALKIHFRSSPYTTVYWHIDIV